jgi:hypothetical protein
VIERKRAILAMDRNQTLRKVAILDRVRRPLLALKSERVDLPPRDPLYCGNGIGTDALVGLRMPHAKAKVAGIHHHRALAAAALHRHHLGAAGDHKVFCSGHDRGGGHGDAGDARATEPVERDARGAHVVSGIEGRHPALIAALLGDLRTGAPDNVIDVGGINAGAVGQRA